MKAQVEHFIPNGHFYSHYATEIFGPDITPKLELELTTYEAILTSGAASNLSLPYFWIMQQENLPNLHKQSFLWCPVSGSSVSVERLFSRLGIIYGNKRRGRLLPSIIESLISIHDANLGDIVVRKFPSRYTQKYAENAFDMARLETCDPIGKPCLFDESDVDGDSDAETVT
ncbi:unnamed protein product, partial [Mesorhabditis belari]|uniref:HAT C-terminal dimerisation domain-containing protein n=1 Tax=Mesorhabditis belari TaxID=2138241 RepID=A0AAF3FCU0_9BILA